MIRTLIVHDVKVNFDRERSEAVDPPVEGYVRRVEAMDTDARYRHLQELVEQEEAQGLLGSEGVRALQMGVKVGMGAHMHGCLWYRLDCGAAEDAEDAEDTRKSIEEMRASSTVEPMRASDEQREEEGIGGDGVADSEDAAAQEAAAVKLQSVRRGILSRRAAKMKRHERVQVTQHCTLSEPRPDPTTPTALVVGFIIHGLPSFWWAATL